MDNRIFQLIDETADRMTTDLNLVVTSIEGSYAREYRNDPTTRGLSRFMRETQSAADTAARFAHRELDSFRDATLPFRTAFNPNDPGNQETLQIALQQVHSAIESLRLMTARRFRAALVSRSSIAPSLGALRVLNRAGRGIQATEMFYLMSRKAAIDVFNEAQLEGLAFKGARLAEVHHRDTNHDLHGQKILIDASAGEHPTYFEVSDVWFHPRSNAVIVEST